MFIDSIYIINLVKSKRNSFFKAFTDIYFQLFIAPPLKGETSENQHPFRVWGKADFHLSFNKKPQFIYIIIYHTVRSSENNYSLKL
jgi:hypothetical protein